MPDSFVDDNTNPDSRAAHDDLSVCRIADCTSADLLAALQLYDQMIPLEQRQGAPEEVVRQLQTAKERRAQGICQIEDCHFVARGASGVCGYMQLFLHPVEKFAFVAFLVVRAGLSLGKQMAWVASRICQEVTRTLALDKEFGACERIFLELDDPGRAADERQRRRGLKRITRFEAICRQCGRELRLLEFDYLQARLGLPADCSGPERPHLLGCISKGAEARMDGAMLRNVLRLIYTRLNPEGVYGGEAEKDGLYRSYLGELCRKECARVPASVRMRTAREIVAQAPCAPRSLRSCGM